MRHYGVKIYENSGEIVEFIETGSQRAASQIIMGVDMNLDHANFYSQSGYIMDKTFKKLQKAGKVAA